MPIQLNPIVEKIPPSGIRKFFDLVLAAGKDVVSLGVGEPDFPTPWHIRESMCYAIEKGFTSYTENAGLLELRKEISVFHNIGKYSPKNEILVTNGVSEGMDLAFRTTLLPGEKILVPDPGYVMYEPLVRLAGGIPVPYNPLQIFGLNIPENTKGIVLNFPGNPLGNTFSKKELEHIAFLAEEQNFLVYSDEIYSALSFDAPHISFLEIPGTKNRTLVFNGLSKSHSMTGLRVGWVCGPEKIISAMTKIHQYSALCVSCVSQLGAVEALRKGDEEMKKMKEIFATRRKFCIEKLDTLGVEYIQPKGAFYLFVKIPPPSSSGLNQGSQQDDILFCEELLETQKLAIVPGSAFGESGKGYVRMTYAASTSELTEAFLRFERFLNNI